MRSRLREDYVLRFAFLCGFISGLLLFLRQTKRSPFVAASPRTRELRGWPF
jgi:hypothetical protein